MNRPDRDTRLDDWPTGRPAVVRAVCDLPGAAAGVAARLAQIGFIAGEPVCIRQRGPGGREPLAVQVGDTMFALRRVEAQCITVAEPDARG